MRLAEPLGAHPETLMGLSGLGDLVLTCPDDQLCNRRLGLMLGRGHSVSEAAAEIGTVEVVRAAPEVLKLAKQHGIETPLIEQGTRVLAGQTSPVEAVARWHSGRSSLKTARDLSDLALGRARRSHNRIFGVHKGIYFSRRTQIYAGIFYSLFRLSTESPTGC